MKKLSTILLMLAIAVFLTACSKSNTPIESQQVVSENTDNQKQNTGTSRSLANSTATHSEGEVINDVGKRTNITLTIGNTVLTAYLNNTTSAQDLISHLPAKVKLNNSDNDYCGDINPPLAYKKEEVQVGYKNGDLAFWTVGNDFVIFVKDEDKSANTGNLVIIGKVTSGLEKVSSLGSSFEVTIALAE